MYQMNILCYLGEKIWDKKQVWEVNLLDPSVHWGTFGGKCVIHVPFMITGMWLTYFCDKKKETNFAAYIFTFDPNK